jgi:hypothetical protein
MNVNIKSYRQDIFSENILPSAISQKNPKGDQHISPGGRRSGSIDGKPWEYCIAPKNKRTLKGFNIISARLIPETPYLIRQDYKKKINNN